MASLLDVESNAFLKSAPQPLSRLPLEIDTPRFQSAATSRTPPVVFVVDDDEATRKSLVSLVESTGWAARAFDSAREFLEQPPTTVPSCLVLDAGTSEIDGLELQKRAAMDRPEMPVIFLTRVRDVGTAVTAMKAGALDFLIKPCAGEVLVQAIASALRRSHAALDRQVHEEDLLERYESLSQRERDVLVLVVTGQLNKQVGARLGISEITVKAHRGNAMRKMRARSLPHLVTMAAELGLGQPGFSGGPAPRRFRQAERTFASRVTRLPGSLSHNAFRSSSTESAEGPIKRSI